MLDYLLYGLFIVLGVIVLVAYTYHSINVRRERIESRSPFAFEEWIKLNPNVSSKALHKALDAIGQGLGIDSKYLRPEDEFGHSLVLSGQLMIDDDTIEDVAESVEELTGISWNKDWNSVSKAVNAISAQLERKTGQNE